MATLTPHSDDTFLSLKSALLDRAYDKESSVRHQTIVALSAMQSSDDAPSPSASSSPTTSDDELEDESDDDDTVKERTEKRKRRRLRQQVREVKRGMGKKDSKDQELTVGAVLLDVLCHDTASYVLRSSTPLIIAQ